MPPTAVSARSRKRASGRVSVATHWAQEETAGSHGRLISMLFRRDREQDPRVLADPHRLPPGQVLTQKWPVLSYGSPPRYDMAKWRLRLFGAGGAPAALTWGEV